MPIKIRCEKCDHSYNVPDKFAGKKGRCSHCGAPIFVPLGTPNAIDEEPPPLPPSIPAAKVSSAKKAANVKPDGYAGIFQRTIAYLIDMTLLSPIAVLLFIYVINPKITPFIEDASQRILVDYRQLFAYAISSLIVVILLHCLAWPYFTFFETFFNATLGKFVFGIYVTDTNKKKISLGVGICRYLAKIFSLLPLGLGFLLIITSKKNQSLHDRMCHTLVFSSGSNSAFLYGIRFVVFIGAIASAISPVFLSSNIANIESVQKIKANTLFYHLIKGWEFSGGGVEDLAHQLGIVPLEEIIPTSVGYFLSDMLSESDAKLTNAITKKMGVMDLEDILKLIAFKEEIKWETFPIVDENDPYAKTHFRVVASFLTQKSHPMKITFKCAYNQQDVIIFESVFISGKNLDVGEFYRMIFMAAIRTAITDTKSDFSDIEAKHSEGLELGKIYKLKTPLYTSSKIDIYNELIKTQISNDEKTNEKIKSLMEINDVIYLDFNAEIEVVEMTPSLEYPDLCSVVIQGDKTLHYFLLKPWIASAVR